MFIVNKLQNGKYQESVKIDFCLGFFAIIPKDGNEITKDMTAILVDTTKETKEQSIVKVNQHGGYKIQELSLSFSVFP